MVISKEKLNIRSKSLIFNIYRGQNRCPVKKIIIMFLMLIEFHIKNRTARFQGFTTNLTGE